MSLITPTPTPEPAQNLPEASNEPETVDDPETTVSTGTPSDTETVAPIADLTPRDNRQMLSFAPLDVGASDFASDTPTVEELLEKGWYADGASPVHVAIKGTPEADSIRCQWHGVARTLIQREEQIRFLLGLADDTELPSPQDVETIFTDYAEGAVPGWDEKSKAWMIPLARGELSAGYLVLSCYADYAVSEYILGEGPSTVTIVFEQTQHDYSYDVYVTVQT